VSNALSSLQYVLCSHREVALVATHGHTSCLRTSTEENGAPNPPDTRTTAGVVRSFRHNNLARLIACAPFRRGFWASNEQATLGRPPDTAMTSLCLPCFANDLSVFVTHAAFFDVNFLFASSGARAGNLLLHLAHNAHGVATTLIPD